MTFRPWQPIASVVLFLGLIGTLGWPLSRGEPESSARTSARQTGADGETFDQVDPWELLARFSSNEWVKISIDPSDGSVCFKASKFFGPRGHARIQLLRDPSRRDLVMDVLSRSELPSITCVGPSRDPSPVRHVLHHPESHFVRVTWPIACARCRYRTGSGDAVEAVAHIERYDGRRIPTSRCGRPFPFVPTYLPSGFTRRAGYGSGGQSGSPLPHIDADAHYGSGGLEGFIDVVATHEMWAQSRRRRIEVLGGIAKLGWIHEGYSVEFTFSGCDYSLNAYGVSIDELRRFAEGLRPR